MPAPAAFAFDALTRSLAARFSRRHAVQAACLGLAAGLTGHVAAPSAQEATPGASDDEDARTFFLFVQTFQSGTLLPHVTDPALYTLTLTGHAAETVYFSDRPERIVGTVPTTEFLDTLGFPAENPPNAALVAGDDVVVLELLNPVYTESFGPDGAVMLTYDVAILADYAKEGLAHLALRADTAPPERFDSASLFIDDCPQVNQDCWLWGSAYNDCYVVGNLGWRDTCWKPVGPSSYSYACVPCNDKGVVQECIDRYPECAQAQRDHVAGCNWYPCR